MKKTKSTKAIRRLPPETRKVAKLRNELRSITRRLTNLLPELAIIERENEAWIKRQEHYKDSIDPMLNLMDKSILSHASKTVPL